MTPGYPDPSSLAVARSASRLFGTPRFDGYLVHCRGDRHAALRLYQWNAAASAAAWETLGHLEIAVRNAMADALESRHRRHGRHGSWLDDPANELGFNARRDIAKARARVSTKRKPASDGQTMAELGSGSGGSCRSAGIKPRCGPTWPAPLAMPPTGAWRPSRHRSCDCTSSATGWHITNESGPNP